MEMAILQNSGRRQKSSSDSILDAKEGIVDARQD